MINLKFNLQRRNGIFKTTIIHNVMKDSYLVCLVDTGAMFPVWCSTESELLNIYPNAIRLNAISFISGFGQGKEKVSLYKIPDFKLCDGTNTIHYINLIVALLNKDFTFDMVLSYTMFNKMNISFDTFTNRNKTHSVIPNFKVASIKDTYYVGIKQKSFDGSNRDKLIQKYNTNQIYTDIYLFTQ